MATGRTPRQARDRNGPGYADNVAKSKIVSAGLLLWRRGREKGIEVLLVHPGGPLWAKKDEGAWSLPKGQIDEGEDALACAQREFTEETGFGCEGPYVPLGSVRLKSGKRIQAWAFEGDCDPTKLRSNLFEMEWPPRSGRRKSFPEADRAAFFDLETARVKIHPAQAAFLDALEKNVLEAR